MTANQKKDLVKAIESKGNIPEHVAIIMDGNRRWAKNHGFNIEKGHDFGVKKIEEIIDIAAQIGVKILTLYAFSSENWNRNKNEIEYLISILREYLSDDYMGKLIAKNVKLITIGNIEKFDKDIIERIKELEEITKNNTKITLCLTLSYGGKDEIIRMTKLIATQVKEGKLDPKDINENIVNENMYLSNYNYPDLVIRSGGEKRISNFLLWYIAYSELYFTDIMWPDFGEMDFLSAIADYQLRERRYGSI